MLDVSGYLIVTKFLFIILYPLPKHSKLNNLLKFNIEKMNLISYHVLTFHLVNRHESYSDSFVVIGFEVESCKYI